MDREKAPTPLPRHMYASDVVKFRTPFLGSYNY